MWAKKVMGGAHGLFQLWGNGDYAESSQVAQWLPRHNENR